MFTMTWIRNVGFAVVLLLLGIGSAHAAEFLASLDKTQGTLEDYFQLTLTVKGATGSSVPEIPASDDFQINYRGQSTQMQWINGQSNHQIVFNYVLSPKREGLLQVPSTTVTIDGEQYQSQEIQVQVFKPSQVPAAQRPAFIQSTLSAERAYPNQQLVYTVEVFIQREFQATDLRFEPPVATGFHLEDLDEVPVVRRVVGGRTFEVHTIRMALYPLKSGTLTIPPATVHGAEVVQGRNMGLGNFGFSLLNTQKKPFRLLSDPVQVEVQSFPSQGRPADFYGLVGKYAIRAELSQPSLPAGDSTTLHLVISGPGRAEAIRRPELEFPDHIKTYEDQPIYQNNSSGDKIFGQTDFSVALVPSQPGTYSLPEMRVTFFNPQTQSYESQTATLPSLQVTPGESQSLNTVGGETPSAQKSKVQQLGEDLLPIHRDLAALRNQSFDTNSAVFVAIAFVAPMLLFGFGGFWRWRSAHSVANADKIRRSQAWSRFQKEMLPLKNQTGDPVVFIKTLMTALQGYIGDKAIRTGEALTAPEMELWLKEHQVREETIAQFNELLSQCEMAQYAAGALSGDDQTRLYETTRQIVEQLEAQLK